MGPVFAFQSLETVDSNLYKEGLITHHRQSQRAADGKNNNWRIDFRLDLGNDQRYADRPDEP